MVFENKVEFLSINEKANGKFDLALRIENVKKLFEVEIIDRDGVFGIDFPSELHILLREFPMSHKKLVEAVRTDYKNLFTNSNLQAA